MTNDRVVKPEFPIFAWLNWMYWSLHIIYVNGVKHMPMIVKWMWKQQGKEIFWCAEKHGNGEKIIEAKHSPMNRQKVMGNKGILFPPSYHLVRHIQENTRSLYKTRSRDPGAIHLQWHHCHHNVVPLFLRTFWWSLTISSFKNIVDQLHTLTVKRTNRGFRVYRPQEWAQILQNEGKPKRDRNSRHWRGCPRIRQTCLLDEAKNAWKTDVRDSKTPQKNTFVVCRGVGDWGKKGEII